MVRRSLRRWCEGHAWCALSPHARLAWLQREVLALLRHELQSPIVVGEGSGFGVRGSRRRFVSRPLPLQVPLLRSQQNHPARLIVRHESDGRMPHA